jgi:myo-inositol 2-dehydrogenase / D-chiro-inositol 1-dehydrogenase
LTTPLPARYNPYAYSRTPAHLQENSDMPTQSPPKKTRREFLKTASAVATGRLAIGRGAHAAGTDVIRIGLIGCGGRGPGAALNAMTVDPGARLVAMTDIVKDRVLNRRKLLKQQKPEQVAVDDDHCFSGLEGYRHVIASADVVLVACAAKFHPVYLRAAIEAGKHVFVEKPHAIDPVGVRAVTAACDLAKQKGLSVQSGLHSRYSRGYQETIKRIHGGAIGEIVAIEENFLRGPYGIYKRQPGMNEVEYQFSNQYHFTWLSGDDVAQSLVHNVDRALWAMNGQVPQKAHGMGGRSASFGEVYGNVFDHHGVVYEFAGGARMYAFCRTQFGCYDEYSSLLLGTKGRCNLMQCRIEGETNWRYADLRSEEEPHQAEHRPFFAAIRSGSPLNAGDYMARSTMAAVMGQMTCYSGKEVTWEQMIKSNYVFLPRPEDVSLNMEPPVKPGASGEYPVFARPGLTKIV